MSSAPDRPRIQRVHALPSLPAAPELGSDPRQGHGATAGFYASAVDLGRLQDALERCVSRLSTPELLARWPEVEAWTQRLLSEWVQGTTASRVSREEGRIVVELETRDARGSYRYVFELTL